VHGLTSALARRVGEKADKSGCSERQRAHATSPEPKAAPAPVAAAAPVSEMERQLVQGGKIRLENVYFESESNRLLPESEAALVEAGHALEKFPKLKLEVQGHTDTRGSAKYNMRLSQARAESVRRFLLDHFILQPDHIAKGYGETQPGDPGAQRRGDACNRRVVINVLNPEAPPHGVVEKLAVTLSKHPWRRRRLVPLIVGGRHEGGRTRELCGDPDGSGRRGVVTALVA
jgi:outer membrane protein OmpA-like peptidoglycan-associated protein